MSPGGKSEKSGDGVRPECANAFGGIDATLKSVDTTLKMLGNKLDGFQASVSKLGERIAAQEQSNKGLWNEYRKDIQPQINALPSKIEEANEKHIGNCPAYAAAMARARNNGKASSKNSIAPAKRNLLDMTLLKWILYAGVFTGAVLAGIFAAFTVVKSLSSILPF